MPEIARFFGIIIRMYRDSGKRHSVPHLHAYYQGRTAVYDVDPIICLAGNLPRRQCRFVEAWMELHQQALARNWELIDNGEPIEPLPPLRR